MFISRVIVSPAILTLPQPLVNKEENLVQRRMGSFGSDYFDDYNEEPDDDLVDQITDKTEDIRVIEYLDGSQGDPDIGNRKMSGQGSRPPVYITDYPQYIVNEVQEGVKNLFGGDRDDHERDYSEEDYGYLDRRIPPVNPYGEFEYDKPSSQGEYSNEFREFDREYTNKNSGPSDDYDYRQRAADYGRNDYEYDYKDYKDYYDYNDYGNYERVAHDEDYKFFSSIADSGGQFSSLLGF